MELEKHVELEQTLPLRRGLASSLAPESRTYRSPPAHRTAPPKVLLVATLFKLPYRTLRCIATTGAEVYVLGAGDAHGLRYSRYCEKFITFAGQIDGRPDAALAEEINRVASTYSIDLVVAGDAPSTRSLIALSEELEAPCFPMPDIAAFDTLNNKWRFTQLCKELHIACPERRLFSDAERLAEACRSGRLGLPLIAKPLSLDSSAGCVEVADESEIEKLSKVSYSPIIVQDYIAGIDIGSSIFCRDGEIEAFLVHNYANGAYTAFSEPGIYDSISQIAWRLRLTGIFNFDMRLTPDGGVYFLECNPRVFFKIAMSMLAGINFLGMGFPWRSETERSSFPDPVTIRFPKAMLGSLLTPWKFDGGTWRVLKFLLEDPLPFFRENLGLERGR